ncbi:MAG: hypothetical protein GX061_01405 [Eubacteriaceae bacterium]|nr:hypothetical protein [Eubacteriaceae bacterium]
MAQKNEITLFLASSVTEFYKQRRQIGDIFRRLNNRLVPEADKFVNLKKCEYEEIAVAKGRKQEEYNALISLSDIFAALIGEKVGSYTLEEYEQAKLSSAQIVVYIVSPPEGKPFPESVALFIEKLKSNGDDFLIYDDFEEVKKDILGRVLGIEGFLSEGAKLIDIAELL